MKRLLVFLAVALMLLVASCGDGNTVSGYVVVKRHNPVRHYTTRDAVTQTCNCKFQKWCKFLKHDYCEHFTLKR